MSFPRYPSYKDSGVEWLGRVPTGWKVVPLKAVSTHNDDVLEESTAPDTEIAYVDISSVDGVNGIKATETMSFAAAPSRARRRVQHGDVIVSTVRTYLKAIARIREPEENLIVSTGFAVIRPSGDLLPEFLGHLVSAGFFVEQVIARSTGVSYPAINASELIAIPVPVPPLPEQTQIAAFLDRETAKIDALVAEQRRLMDLLKEKRQAVISHAVTRGLNPEAPMKPSGVEWLGDVPAHWDIVPLSVLATMIQTGPFGSQLHSSDYVENGTPVINPSNIQDGRLDPDWSCSISAENVERLSQHRLTEGDIVFGRRGEMGRCALVTSSEVGWVCGTGSLNVRLSDRAYPPFISTYLRTEYVREWLKLQSVGSTMDNLNTQILGSINVPVPPVTEQQAIVAFVEKFTTQFDTLTTEAQHAIDLLQERRTALISAAVTGQIDVRGVAQSHELEAIE